MRKTLAATVATLALLAGLTPAANASDTPNTPGPVGTITEPLQHPQWKTDGDHYGDTESCESPDLTYPQGCVVFPNFGFDSMRYVLQYVTRLYEEHAAAEAKIDRQQAKIKAQAAKIAKLKKRLRH